MASNANFVLTPQQQELLFAALNANRPGVSNSLTVPPRVTELPTTQPADLSDGVADSSLLDYDYSFDNVDNGLDFSIEDEDQSNYLDGFADDDVKTESAPSSADNDSADKRSHPDDEDEDGSSAKRREGTEKVPKKPGRKPLTSEPSSKRKAQNRAAQRAFRERKEKHLKDLETKVAELEKASEVANTENGVLRARVEKMTVELSEYKKRMTLMARPRVNAPQAGPQLFGNPIFNNINDVNFQFEFPKFGQLPGPGAVTNSNSPGGLSSAKSSPRNDISGLSTAATSNVNSPADSANSVKKSSTREDLSKLSSIFSPPLTSGNIGAVSRSSMDSASTSSPSASSHSNTAPSSSCGTSPEPFTQSPMGFKPVDTLTTIGEEQPTMFANTNTSTPQDASKFANVDFGDMSWLNGQSNFRFDPQLFGDYREPQENILSSGGFDESFFNDALDVDFTTPFNMAPSPILHKPDLIAQIDAAKEGEFASSSINIPKPAEAATTSTSSPMALNCNKIWERLQNCPKVQNGDFDLDGLCSDLQKKAKCSGSGPVVDEKDFKFVMAKYLDKDGDKSCADNVFDDVKAEA